MIDPALSIVSPGVNKTCMFHYKGFHREISDLVITFVQATYKQVKNDATNTISRSAGVSQLFNLAVHKAVHKKRKITRKPSQTCFDV